MNEWFKDRGIPYTSEVMNGYGNDGPLDSSVVSAMSTLMTNLDRPIYAFTSAMPVEVTAALFARYSRSPRPLRMVLAREFWDKDGLDLAKSSGASIADVKAARQLFKRVLAEYGDDSVAQLGVAWLACEMVSQLAVKEIEDGRIGAWLEKSTRYVDFGKEVNGKYLYLRPTEIVNSFFAGEYEQIMDEAFNLYGQTVKVLMPYLRGKFPIHPGDDEAVYKSSIRAKAFDIARAFLPMSTLTNVGMALSAQAFEGMVNKMMTSPLSESRVVAADMHNEANIVIPSLISRIEDPESGGKARNYLNESRLRTRELAMKTLEGLKTCSEEATASGVELVWSQDGALNRVVSAILYPHAHVNLSKIRELVEGLSDGEKRDLIDAYVSGRTNRRHKPGRAFEEAVYEFNTVGNVGVWRDLQRMRLVMQQRQLLTVVHGVDIPEEFSEVGIDGVSVKNLYLAHMEKRSGLFHKIASGVSPEVAQYVVGFGNLMQWSTTVNMRELFHLIPLRAGKAGHPAYRKIAREMFYKIAERDPILAMPMEQYIDFSDEPRLERLEQLAKVKEKLDRLGGGGTDTFITED